VLFLDELPEFGRGVLEVLRQPMEEGRITLSRAAGSVTYPSRCMVVVALNPCPCGHFGQAGRRCTCGEAEIARYLRRISGPLLDRIDLQVEVGAVPFDKLTEEAGERSADIRARVVRALTLQRERLASIGSECNAHLSRKQVGELCALSEEGRAFLRMAFDSLSLSARSYDRLCKVARTIADLEGAADIGVPHLAEAVRYRALDRKYWQRGR